MIEKACSIILATAAAVCAAVIVRNSFFLPPPAPSEQQVSGEALIGQPVPGFGSGTQLVLAISSHCPYCLRSMPLYRKIAGSKAGFSLVALALEDQSVFKQFLNDNQLKVDGVKPVPVALPIQYTPTLLLVNDGRIKHAWVGMQDSSQFAKGLHQVCPECKVRL